MKLKIANEEELNRWMNERKEHRIEAVKGLAPKGATYEDGTLITNPVNIGRFDVDTQEEFHIIYEME